MLWVGLVLVLENARRLKSPHAKHLPTVSDYAQFGRPNMAFEKRVSLMYCDYSMHALISSSFCHVFSNHLSH